MRTTRVMFAFALSSFLAIGLHDVGWAQQQAADSAPRIWTSGASTTSATLVKFEDGVVHLKKTDGTVVRLAIDKLSAADQEYVKKRVHGDNKDNRVATTKSGDGADTSELVVKSQRLCEEITRAYRGRTSGGKATIAVLEFSDLSGGVTDFGRLLSEELITKLFATGNYKVIERLLLNKAMSEHKLVAQGFIATDTAKELGKILGVDAIVSGTVADLGGSLRVNARLISSETGEVLSVAAATFGKDDTINGLMTGGGQRTFSIFAGASSGTNLKQAVSEPDGSGIKITVERAVKDRNEIELTVTIRNDTDSEKYLWLETTGAMDGGVSLLSNSGKKWQITAATNFGIYEQSNGYGHYLSPARYGHYLSPALRTKFNHAARYAPGEVKEQKLTFNNSDDPGGEVFEFLGKIHSSASEPWNPNYGVHPTEGNAVSKIIKGVSTSPRAESPKRK